VKVATYNINNINKRLDNLLAWLAKAQPDVVSLQELKAEQEAFPVNALLTPGYEAVIADATIPVAKTRIPAASVTCERICGST
jgi:exonuclease III